MSNEIHPSYAQILRWFAYSQLPEPLQKVSKRFYDLAHIVAEESEGPEGTVALRKLLEAKDAAVRARLQGNPMRADE